MKINNLFLLFVITVCILSSSYLLKTSIEPYKLIAHRGGVVEDKYAENSEEALQAAITRKYWMIEVDIRETKDGVAITQHDADFARFYNTPKKVGEMTWNEIKQLKSTPGNRSPLTFEELVILCKGKINLMLDTKEPHSEKFCSVIESILHKHDMLASSYVIGSADSRKHFLGKAKVGANSEMLQQRVEDKENIADRYILFEHGNKLTEAEINWAKDHHVTVVPSINKFHYYKQSNVMKLAGDDISRLKALGVTQFQIDSEFDQYFN